MREDLRLLEDATLVSLAQEYAGRIHDPGVLEVLHAGSIGHYKIKGYLGRGEWTVVLAATKTTDGSQWALKLSDPSPLAQAQYAQRGLTPELIWQKEGLNGYNCGRNNLAWNTVEEVEGLTFLAEERIERFLSDRITSMPMDLEEAIHIATGLAHGLADLHRDTRRAHCDLKPDNVGYSNQNGIKISDFGTSTVVVDYADAVRDTMGAPSIRAPEVWKEGSHPHLEADIWSFGALVYRLATGHYPLADRDQEYMRTSFSSALTEEVYAEIDMNITDKNLGSLLKECLVADPEERIADGIRLQKRVELYLAKKEKKEKWRNVTIRAAQTVGLAVVAAAVGFGLAYGITRPTQPLNFALPVISEQEAFRTEGSRSDITTYWPTGATETPFVFDIEYDSTQEDLSIHYDDVDNWQYMTIQHYMAVLFLTYDNAFKEVTGNLPDHNGPAYLFNETQFDMSVGIPRSYASGTYGTLYLRTILNTNIHELNKEGHGEIDLEDLLTASVVGMNALNRARLANGTNFSDYINARDPKTGEHIIGNEDREFIKTWVQYSHQIAVPAEGFHLSGRPVPLNGGM